MNRTFSAEFFAQNRASLRTLFTGKAPIVLTANGLVQQSGDQNYPFHQDASFWYLTGVDIPDVILVMDKDKEYMIVPNRHSVQEAFDGAINPEEITRFSGITTVMDEKNGWKQLNARLKKVQHIATLGALPTFLESHSMYTNPARRTLVAKIQEINPAIELLDIRPHLARMRMVKQPIEVAAIQTAIDLTIAALKQVKRKLPHLAYEYEIQAVITAHFLSHGASNAWEPVIAAGANACVIHAQGGATSLSADELVLIDVGAAVEHYVADITRTWSIGSKLSRRHEAVFAGVLEAQNYAFSLLKPGVVLKDYERQVEQFMGEKLRALGLIKTIESEAVRRYFPHATSHFLGIDPHDGGDYERPLEPGVVLAVEPGIYIPEEAIGVRIEDDVLITKTGIEILSSKLPRDLL